MRSSPAPTRQTPGGASASGHSIVASSRTDQPRIVFDAGPSRARRLDPRARRAQPILVRPRRGTGSSSSRASADGALREAGHATIPASSRSSTTTPPSRSRSSRTSSGFEPARRSRDVRPDGPRARPSIRKLADKLGGQGLPENRLRLADAPEEIRELRPAQRELSHACELMSPGPEEASEAGGSRSRRARLPGEAPGAIEGQAPSRSRSRRSTTRPAMSRRPPTTPRTRVTGRRAGPPDP
jgi:hypothetical protein